LRRLFMDGKDSLPSKIKNSFNVITDKSTSHVLLQDVFKHYLARPFISYEQVSTEDLVLTSHHQRKYVNRPGQSTHCIQETKRLLALHQNHEYNEDPIILFIHIWNDGFDPNDNIKGRELAWAQSITILTDYSDPSHVDSSYNTFLITLGKDTDDHRQSQIDLIQALNELSFHGINNTFWVQSKAQFMRLYVSVCSWICDQPERRSYCGLLGGNSQIHSRWGLLYQYNDINSIAPCAICTGLLLDPATVIATAPINCPNQCICWDFYDHSIKPTFASLRTSFLANREKFHASVCTKTETRRLLNASGICHALCDSALLPDPEGFEYPPVWDFGKQLESTENNIPQSHCVILDVFIDAPMHLLALGTTKAVMEVFLQHMKTLMYNMEPIIDECINITSSIKLSWLSVLPLSQQYVSDNHLSIARIAKWISTTVMLHIGGIVKETRTRYLQKITGKPFSQWTNAELKLFLKSIGETTGGTKDDLVDRSISSWNNYLQRFTERNFYVGDETLRIVQMMELTSAIASRVLQPVYHSSLIKETRACVLSLLTVIYNSPYRVEISNKYNYFSLINIPLSMERWGPLKFHWEGSYRGEKILSTIKPNLHKNGKDWWVHTLRSVLVHLYLQGIQHDVSDDTKLRSVCKSYNSREEVNQLLDNGIGIVSACITKKKHFFCLKHEGGIISLIVIAHTHYGNNTYLQMKSSEQSLTSVEMQELMEDIDTFVMLLPVCVMGKVTHLLFTKSWKQLVLENHEYVLVPYTVTQKYPLYDILSNN
jgi:hypothetical protein